MVNRKQAEAMVSKWQNRLGLQDWRIVLEFNSDGGLDSGHDMCIVWPRGYQTGTIHIKAETLMLERWRFERDIVHELLHLCLAPMTDELERLVGDSSVIYDTVDRACERTVDKLATVIERGWKDGRSRRS